MEKIGKKMISEWLEGHLVPIERRLRFINDVLEDPKEGGLKMEELDPLFDDFELISELQPEFDLGLIRTFIERMENPEISDKIKYGKLEEVLNLAKRCLTYLAFIPCQ
jgi:hypothetical protein